MNAFQFYNMIFSWGFTSKEELHTKVDNKEITESEYNQILKDNEATANEN